MRLPGCQRLHGSPTLPRIMASICHGGWRLALSEGVDCDAAPVSFPQSGPAYALRRCEALR
jgi:hypothetical protein